MLFPFRGVLRFMQKMVNGTLDSGITARMVFNKSVQNFTLPGGTKSKVKQPKK